MKYKIRTQTLRIFLNLFAGLLLIFATHTVIAENKITFYHYDLLGSPVAATDEQGNIVWREEYSPWGKKLLNQDATKDNVRGYTGHVHDKETGLTYMQARYYDPDIIRFMGIDPVGFKENDPIYFNKYVYAGNNPYKFVDPNGKSYLKALMAVGVAYSAYSGYQEDGMLGVGKELSGYNDRMDALESLNKGEYGGVAFSVLSIACKGCKGVKNAVKDAVKNTNYSRPSGFRKGVRDKAWNNSKEVSTGQVRDRVSGRFMSKDKSWDMGHKKGYEFRKHQKSAEARNIDRKKFLDEHNSPDKYEPELPESNRSHKGEDMTDDYFGD